MKDRTLNRNVWGKEISDPNERTKDNAKLNLLDGRTKNRNISNKRTETENVTAPATEYKSIPDMGIDCIDQNYYYHTIVYIMLTCPCNEDEDPLHPTLYSKAGVYRGIHFFFLFLL